MEMIIGSMNNYILIFMVTIIIFYWSQQLLENNRRDILINKRRTSTEENLITGIVIAATIMNLVLLAILWIILAYNSLIGNGAGISVLATIPPLVMSITGLIGGVDNYSLLDKDVDVNTWKSIALNKWVSVVNYISTFVSLVITWIK